MANEKRLIDANALQLEPDPWGGMNGVLIAGRSGGKTMGLVQAALKRMIENAPTVDAVEVVHGYWKTHSQIDTVFVCSECNLNVDDFEKRWLNYCPNCGAKMDGGDADV